MKTKLPLLRVSILLAGMVMAVGAGLSSINQSFRINAVAGALIATADSDTIVTNAAYDSIYKTDDWNLTYGGNNKSGGTNSGNRGNCILKGDYAKYADGTNVTTSDTVFAFANTAAFTSANRINFTYSGGSGNANGGLYLNYSTDGLTYTPVTLTTGTQGMAVGSINTTYEMEFETIPSAYYAVCVKDIVATEGNFRFDSVVVNFYEGPVSTKEITALSTTGTPTKTAYLENEVFDPAGLTVTATFDDQSSEDVSSVVTWTPKPLIAGTTAVTGTYTYKHVAKTVEVTGIQVTGKTLVSMEVTTLPKTAYTTGEAISYTGMVVTGTYNNNETANITSDCTMSPVAGTILANGTTTVTVSHSGIASVTFDVTAEETTTYVAVTSSNYLSAGDKIVIASTDGKTVMSTTQNDNNRGKVAATLTDTTLTPTAGYQEIILGKGTKDPSKWTLNVGSITTPSYLYASSSSKNYLNSRATNSDANSEWAIAGDATGMTITATGDKTRNRIFYNASSSIFSCYVSTNTSMGKTAIYRLPYETATEAFAEQFLTATEDCTATAAKVWSIQKETFLALVTGDQASLTSASYNSEQYVTNTIVEKALQRYDLAVRDLGLENFMNRTPLANSAQLPLSAFDLNTTALVSIVVISIGLLAMSIIIVRKHEERA